MPAKLTKDIVNGRIIDRGITLIGEYNGALTLTDFECKYGHIWATTPNSILRGNGCRSCSGRLDGLPLSKEIMNERLEKSDRGIRQVGDYINAHTKAEFQCKCGYKWLSKPGNIMSGKGCPSCSDRLPLSKDIVNERLSSDGRGIRQVGEYNGTKTKAEFQCKCGYKWSTTPGNVMAGHGCPLCADYGFNPGKSAWIYILIFADYIKYGITNNLDQRLRQHLNNGQYTVALSKLYSDGNQALLWERNIKIIFGGHYVSKEIMPDGYTETLSPDKLEALLDTVR